MSQDFEVLNDIWPSALGYSESPEDYVLQVLLSYISKHRPRSTYSRILYEQARNTLRRSLGYEALNPLMLRAGGSQHELIAQRIRQRDDNDRIGTRILSNILELEGETNVDHYVRGRSNNELIKDHVVGEKEIEHKLKGMHGASSFKADSLVFLERNGKRIMYIVDYKASPGGNYHRYDAQIAEYAERWWDKLSAKQRRAILPEKYKEWADDQGGVTVRGAIIPSGNILYAGERKSLGKVFDVSGQNREVKQSLGRANRAISQVFGETGIPEIIESAYAGHISDSAKKRLLDAVQLTRDFESRQVDPLMKARYAEPNVKPVPIIEMNSAKQTRLVRETTPVRISVAGKQDKVSRVQVNRKWKEFPSVERLSEFLLGVNEDTAAQIESIEFGFDAQEDPGAIVSALQSLNRRQGRSGLNPFEIDTNNDLLVGLLGKPVDQITLDGETVRAGDQLSPNMYVDSIRSYKNGRSMMTVQVGNDKWFTLPVRKTPKGFTVGGFAVTPMIDPPEQNRTAPGYVTAVTSRPTDNHVRDQIVRAAEARIFGKMGGMARVYNIEDQPLAYLTVAQRSRTLTGVSPYNLQANRDFLYWSRSDLNLEGGRSTGRLVATDIDEFLSSVPGYLRTSDDRVFTGRSREKAVKWAKDAKKALRPEHVLSVLEGSGSIESYRGKRHGSDHRTRGTKFNLALMHSGVFTQGSGYVIMPKDVEKMRATARISKSFEVPEGFELGAKARSGEMLNVDGDGYVTVGHRTTGQRDDKTGEMIKVPVRMKVGTSYDQIAFSPKTLSAFEGIDTTSGMYELGYTAYAPQFSMKEAGIKAFLRTLTWDEAVELFGAEGAKVMAGEDGGESPTLVLGIDAVKSLPRFLRGLADAINMNLEADTPDAIYGLTREVMNKAHQGTYEVELDWNDQSLAGRLVHESRRTESGGVRMGVSRFAFLTPVVAEWIHGKTRINPEEAMHYATFFPEYFKDAQKKSLGPRATAASIARAYELQLDPGKETKGEAFTVTKDLVVAANQAALAKDTSAQPGDVFREMAAIIREEYDATDPYRVMRLAGTDVYLPSIQAMAQMSTMDIRGEEVNALSKASGALMNLVSMGQPVNREETKPQIEAFTEKLAEVATSETVRKKAGMISMPRSVGSAFLTHPNMPEGGIFVPPQDLVDMLPGFKKQLEMAAPEERENLLRYVYGKLAGEHVSYFRRPSTDPMYTVLPMEFVNPFEHEGLRDLAKGMSKDPFRRDMRAFVSDLAFESASADVDFDIALMSMLRDLNIDWDEERDGQPWRIWRGRGEDKQEVSRSGQRKAAQDLLQRYRDLKVIPNTGKINTTRDALRYMTLQRAHARGAKFVGTGGRKLDPEDTQTALRMIGVTGSDDLWTRTVRQIAGAYSKADYGRKYNGSQIRAMFSDIGGLGAEGGGKDWLFRELGLDDTLEDFTRNRFMTRTDISRGSLEMARAKKAMGPTYNNLRIFSGAFQNRLKNGGFRTRGELLNAYKQIAAFSDLYQKSLDLQQLTEAEKMATSKAYLRRTQSGGYSYFDQFSGENVTYSGVHATGDITTALNIGATGFVPEILDRLLGNSTNKAVRNMNAWINTPSAGYEIWEAKGQLRSNQFYVPAGALLDAKHNRLDPNNPQHMGAIAGAEAMQDFITQTSQDIATQGIEWMIASGYMEDLVSEMVPSFDNPKLGGNMLLAKITEGEADVLRALEKMPLKDVKAYAKAAIYPDSVSFDDDNRIQAFGGLAGKQLMEDIEEARREGRGVDVSDLTGKGTAELLVALVKETREMRENLSPRIIYRTDRNDAGYYSNAVLQGILSSSKGNWDLAKTFDRATGGDFSTLISGVDPMRDRSDHFALRTANKLGRLMQQGWATTELGRSQDDPVAMGFDNETTGALLREIARREFTDSGVLETVNWLADTSKIVAATQNPTTAGGFEKWTQQARRLNQMRISLEGVPEILEKQNLTSEAQATREAYSQVSALADNFGEVIEKRFAGESFDLKKIFEKNFSGLISDDMKTGAKAIGRAFSRNAKLLNEATPLMVQHVKELRRIEQDLRANPRSLSREEQDSIGRMRQSVRSYSRMVNSAGPGNVPQEARLAGRGEEALESLAFFGQKPERVQPKKGLAKIFSDPRSGFGSELYFTTRMMSSFIQPLIRAGESYQEFETGLNRSRMLSGQPLNRQAIDIIRRRQDWQYARAQTGGYILSGLNGATPRSQWLADAVGIGGASLGTGMLAGQLVGMIPGAQAAVPVAIGGTMAATAGTLGLARLQGESNDQVRMNSIYRQGAKALERGDIGGLVSHFNLASLWDMTREIGTGYFNGLPLGHAFLEARKNIANEAWTYDEFSGGQATPALMTEVFNADAAGSDAYKEFRQVVGRGQKGQEFNRVLRETAAILGADFLSGTEGMTEEERNRYLVDSGRANTLANAIEAQIVGFTPEAGNQLATSMARATGLTRAEVTEEIYSSDFMRAAIEKGVGQNVIQQFSQYASAMNAVGLNPSRELIDFAPGNFSVTEESAMGMNAGAIQGAAAQGFRFGELAIPEEGQSWLSGAYNSRLRQLQSIFGATARSDEFISSLGMLVEDIDKLDPKQAEALRLYASALQGNAWSMQRMDQSLLPQGMDALPEWFARTDQWGFSVGQRSLPFQGTEMGNAFFNGIDATNPLTGRTHHYQGYEDFIGSGGILEQTIRNAIDAAPVQISHKAFDAMTDLGIGTDMMPMWDAVQGKSMMDIQMDSSAENYRNSMFNLSQRFESLAEKLEFVPRQLDIQQRLFDLSTEKQREQMDRSWEKFEVQWGWGLEDLAKNFERAMTRSGWSESALDLRVNQSQLQYAWNMEDIDEALRYATGRDRRKLLRQQERQTISYSLNMADTDMQRDQIETQRRWAEEDYQIALDRHNQKMTWQQEEMSFARSMFEQEIGLRQELMNINRVMTMNDLQRQQASLVNAQYHLELTYTQQQALFALQAVVQNLAAGISFATNTTQLLTSAVQQYGAQATAVYQQMVKSANTPWGVGTSYGGDIQMTPVNGGGTQASRESSTPSPFSKDQFYCMLHPDDPKCSYATGGPVQMTTMAMVHKGEHVVPQDGALVLREPEVVKLLGQIVQILGSAKQSGSDVKVVVQTNDPQSGYDYGMNLARELELN